MTTAFYRALPVLLCLTSTAWGYDAFSEKRSPTRFAIDGKDGTRLVLKGLTGLAWRDLEGRGGPRHDSTTDTATLGTRSPHFALSGARLAVRVELPDGLAAYSAFGFTPTGARLDSAWFDYRHTDGPWRLHAELGLNQPFVADDWETARAPLAARVYWGQSEGHLTTDLRYTATTWWLAAGVSVAMMRPLESAPINDAAQRRGTISLLAYGPARAYSGNAPILGGKVSIGTANTQFDTFAYRGEMAAAEGTDALRNRIGGFSLLPGFNGDDPHRQDTSAWWVGVRGAWSFGGARLRLEGIRSRESLLFRHIIAAQLGAVWTRSTESFPATLEARIRLERYVIEGGGDALTADRALRSPDPSQAISWDHDVLTVALASQLYRDLLWLRAEHSLIEERNGAPELERPDIPIANHETTIDLELRF